MSKFVQVGTTAMRDPVTGDFLPAVPLYVEQADLDGAVPPPDLTDLGRLLAEKMKAYMDGCRQEGVAV